MNTKNVRLAIFTAAILVSTLLSSCGKNPCSNACGLTAPVTKVEQSIMNVVQPVQQNTLSGGN